MRYKHPLICVEGLDASGKFTIATYIADLLGGEVVSFPRYRTATGKLLLAHLKGEWGAISTTMCGEWTLDAPCQSLADMMVRQALMSVNRYEAQSELLAKLEERPVVLDRYHLSKGGGEYHYDGVPQDVVDGLKKAESAGKYRVSGLRCVCPQPDPLLR